MASTPPSNTARVWIDYNVDGQGHSIQFRVSSISLAGSVVSVFRDFVSANLANFFTETVFSAARAAEEGSNVTNPIDFGSALTGTGGAIPGIYSQVFASIVGRDTAGAKARWYLYGIADTAAFPDDFRVVLSEERDFATVMSDLRDVIEELSITTVSGGIPVINPYTNIGINAYYQRKAREG